MNGTLVSRNLVELPDTPHYDPKPQDIYPGILPAKITVSTGCANIEQDSALPGGGSGNSKIPDSKSVK